MIRKMCKMQWWFWTVILMVFLNTCTVAVEHYNQPQWLTEFLCKYLEVVLVRGRFRGQVMLALFESLLVVVSCLEVEEEERYLL